MHTFLDAVAASTGELEQDTTGHTFEVNTIRLWARK
jgi:hypothetical protein